MDAPVGAATDVVSFGVAFVVFALICPLASAVTAVIAEIDHRRGKTKPDGYYMLILLGSLVGFGVVFAMIVIPAMMGS
jgi:hypothetical protein